MTEEQQRVRRTQRTRSLLASAAIDVRIKESPEDFVVDEVPLYEPSDEGDHVYLRVRKRGVSTREAVEIIAHQLQKPSRDFGVPGLKDKNAVTTQWISIEHADISKLDGFADAQVEILEQRKHNNKLRTGHLLANRFALRLGGMPTAMLDEVQNLLERDLRTLAVEGLPNYYGVQRFGRDNVAFAQTWLANGMGRTRDPKFLISVLQSHWFNEALRRRVADGSYASVLLGDLARKEDSGGMFVVDSLEADAERARAFLISATGPMFGAEMRFPTHDALAVEEKLMQDFSLTPELLASFRKLGAGTRRPYRVRVTEAEVRRDGDALWLRFVLPSGSYATTLLDELVPWVEVRPPRDGDGEAQRTSNNEEAASID